MAFLGDFQCQSTCTADIEALQDRKVGVTIEMISSSFSWWFWQRARRFGSSWALEAGNPERSSILCMPSGHLLMSVFLCLFHPCWSSIYLPGIGTIHDLRYIQAPFAHRRVKWSNVLSHPMRGDEVDVAGGLGETEKSESTTLETSMGRFGHGGGSSTKLLIQGSQPDYEMLILGHFIWEQCLQVSGIIFSRQKWFCISTVCIYCCGLSPTI